jgi:hypothetical protein
MVSEKDSRNSLTGGSRILRKDIAAMDPKVHVSLASWIGTVDAIVKIAVLWSTRGEPC